MQEELAGGAQLERRVRPGKVEHGSDEHLTLLGAAQHLNLLTGQDRADMLAFGRACMAAERERWKEAASYAIHKLEASRVWSGMDWHYLPLHPVNYKPVLERLRVRMANA